MTNKRTPFWLTFFHSILPSQINRPCQAFSKLGKSPTRAIITGMDPLPEKIKAVLSTTSERNAALQETLRLILADFHSETGTIHLLDAEKQLLHLSAQVGLPPQMLDVVKTIPVG